MIFKRHGHLPAPLAASLLLALALLVYTVIRAVKVGFTHDESSSFMNLIHEPVQALFFSARNWQAANNHLTNTICMQIGYHFFGAAEWALRWGSLLGGLLFLIYAFRTVRLWLPVASWHFFGAFCIFTLNHFVIDFFSLARGYGLCLAFEMAALYYLFRWIKQEVPTEAVTGLDNRSTTMFKAGDLLKAGCALGAGVLSNFTLLDLMAAFFVTVTVVFYAKHKSHFAFASWLRLITPPALPALITMGLIFQPMRWIQAKGEFEYGPQAFWETWRVLVERFVYNPCPAYLWIKVVILGVATLLFLLLGYAIFRRFRNTQLSENSTRYVCYAALLTVLTMGMTMLQHYLLGANYLIGRTALLFYPLLSSVVVLYLLDLPKRMAYFHKSTLLWPVIPALLIVNFCSHANLRFAQEWRYDENTRAAVLLASQQSDATHIISYGVGWLYYSTTLFYQEVLKLDNIKVAYNASHDDLSWVTSQPFDLIYIDPALQPKVEDDYVLIKKYPQGVMMRSKRLIPNAD